MRNAHNNPLYDAIIALGRSLKTIALYGVGVNDIRRQDNALLPRCAIGHFSHAYFGRPLYPNDVSLVGSREYATSFTALKALIDALTPEQKVRMIRVAQALDAQNGTPAYELHVNQALSGEGKLADFQSAVVYMNDRVLCGDDTLVYEWFDRAFDLLAAQLPDPLFVEQLAALPAEQQGVPV